MSKPFGNAIRCKQHCIPQTTLDQHIDHAIISLSTMIHIPEEHAPTHFNRFITDYYQYMQREFRAWSEQDTAAPRISTLQVHLERQSSSQHTHPQLHLLSEAYTAMRVLEEVNDHFIDQSQQPLTRYDISIANVIAGTLLGEQHTQQAEAAVNRVLDDWSQNRTNAQSINAQNTNAQSINTPGNDTTRIYFHWPCLATQFGFATAFADLPGNPDLQVSGSE